MKNSKKDPNGNSLKGKILNFGSTNCYLRSESRLIVGIELNDLVVVETNDAILISKKDATQKLKELVNELNERNYPEGKNNKRSFRPWGSFTKIEQGGSWQVKKLEINPNCSISLQMHNHRSEHWIVVDGEAKVEIDGRIKFFKKNESTYIPIGSKHRLSKPSTSPLVIIEVQSGEYLEKT